MRMLALISILQVFLDVLQRLIYLKWKRSIFRSDIEKKLFAVRVVRHRNRLPRVMDAPSLDVFKTSLDRALSILID